MFPEDEAGFGIDDRCYIGSSRLLAKPVMQKGAKEVFVYIAEDQVRSFSLPFIYTHTPTLTHTKLPRSTTTTSPTMPTAPQVDTSPFAQF